MCVHLGKVSAFDVRLIEGLGSELWKDTRVVKDHRDTFEGGFWPQQLAIGVPGGSVCLFAYAHRSRLDLMSLWSSLICAMHAMKCNMLQFKGAVRRTRP